MHESRKKVHIAANTRLFRHGPTDGIGLFTREIMTRLPKLMAQDSFTFLFDKPFSDVDSLPKNVNTKRLFPPTRLPLLMDLFFEWSVPHALKTIQPNVFFSPDGWVSLHAKTPTVSVVHDLNFLHHPEFIAPRWRKYYLSKFPAFIRKADHLITVSQFSKNDLMQALHIPPEKITVVYNSTAEGFRSVSSTDEKEKIQREFADGIPYFLHVGSIHERKNTVGLMQAFGQFRKTYPGPFRLLFAGAKQWWTDSMQETSENQPFRNDILFLGKVSDEALPRIYRGAEALVFPSFFEGFGIPVVEAFKSGIPVITSDCTALPEIAAGAALLIDPHKPEQIADAMHRITSDSALREELIGKGSHRAHDFSWDVAAEQIAQILKTYA